MNNNCTIEWVCLTVKRHLDFALATTHAHVRVFLVTAKCCARAVWLDEKAKITMRLRERHYLSPRVWCELITSWW